MTLREPLQQVLGNAFVIERELTGGGMAQLFVALDTTLNRRVVVKVLPRERAEGVSAERFRAEIRTVAALQHPNIVGILSAGEVEGLPYYMMPFIDGESLRGLLVRDRSMSSRASVSILRDVARACAYAHARGIVHRDIKPDNVMLSGGAALITDFGVSKALSVAQRPAGNTTITREGFTVGTPMYMAPEQLAGDPHIDHRVDFYAMGVMAYEMLAGQVPFAHPTPRALLAAQLSEPPPSLRLIRPDVPIRLAKLVSACLQKEPADRPASADAILAALDDPALMSDEFLAGRSGETHQASTVPVATLRRRRRFRGGVAAAGVVAVLAGVLMVARPGRRPSAAGAPPAVGASIALLPLGDESADSGGAYLADGITRGITARLSRFPGLRLASRSGSDRYRTPQSAPADVGRELNVGTILSGRVKRTGDRLEVTTTLVDAATGTELSSRRIEGAVLGLQQIEDTLAADAAAALSKRFGMKQHQGPFADDGFHSAPAYDQFLQGRYSARNRNTAALQEALQRFHEALSLDSVAVPVYVSLADLYPAMPLYSTMTADLALTRALSFADRAVVLDSASSLARTARGTVLEALWRRDEAGVDLKRAVTLDSADALAREAYGKHLLLAGDVEGAARELRAATALEPWSAEIAGLEGISLVLSGQTEKGIEAARRAVDLEPGVPGPRLLLGAAYLYASRPFDAVFTLAGAVELDPSNPQVLGMLGYAYAVMGQQAKARAMLARLAKGPERAGALAAMGRIHIGLGQPDEALAFLERAVKAHDPLFAEESLYTPIFEPLKLHPRFERLVRSAGLVPRTESPASH